MGAAAVPLFLLLKSNQFDFLRSPNFNLKKKNTKFSNTEILLVVN
jgi:hypothetical protein